MWYLWAVTFFKLIQPIVARLRWPIYVVSIAAALSVLTDAGQNLMCCFTYAPFFTVGMVLPYDELVVPALDWRMLRTVVVLVVVSVAVVAAIAVTLHVPVGPVALQVLTDGFLCTLSDDGDGTGARCASLVQVLLRLAWYASATCIGRLVLKLMPGRQIWHVSQMGARTLQIYVFHIAFIHYCYPVAILLSTLFGPLLLWGIAPAVLAALLVSQVAVALLGLGCVGTLLRPFSLVALLFEGPPAKQSKAACA